MFTFECNANCVEILKGDDVQIRFIANSDTEETTIIKEIHEFDVIDRLKVNDICKLGMTRETIKRYTATGFWEDRYTLGYTAIALVQAEQLEPEPVMVKEPTDE